MKKLTLTLIVMLFVLFVLISVTSEVNAQCKGPDGKSGVVVGKSGDTFSGIKWPECAYYAALEFNKIAPKPGFNFGGGGIQSWINNASKNNWVTSTDHKQPVVGAIVVYGNHVQIVREVYSDGIVVQGMNERWTNNKSGCVYKYKVPYELLKSPNKNTVLGQGLSSFGGFKGYIYPRLKQAKQVQEKPKCSVSTPTLPTGPNSGKRNTSFTFNTGGAKCAAGHSVEYQYYWGDGRNSEWGAAKRSYAWSTKKTYDVRVRARCVNNKDIISTWSSGKKITIN